MGYIDTRAGYTDQLLWIDTVLRIAKGIIGKNIG